MFSRCTIHHDALYSEAFRVEGHLKCSYILTNLYILVKTRRPVPKASWETHITHSEAEFNLYVLITEYPEV